MQEKLEKPAIVAVTSPTKALSQTRSRLTNMVTEFCDAGDMYLKLGRADEAEATFRDAIELLKNVPIANRFSLLKKTYFGLAESFTMRGDYYNAKLVCLAGVEAVSDIAQIDKNLVDYRDMIDSLVLVAVVSANNLANYDALDLYMKAEELSKFIPPEKFTAEDYLAISHLCYCYVTAFCKLKLESPSPELEKLNSTADFFLANCFSRLDKFFCIKSEQQTEAPLTSVSSVSPISSESDSEMSSVEESDDLIPSFQSYADDPIKYAVILGKKTFAGKKDAWDKMVQNFSALPTLMPSSMQYILESCDIHEVKAKCDSLSFENQVLEAEKVDLERQVDVLRQQLADLTEKHNQALLIKEADTFLRDGIIQKLRQENDELRKQNVCLQQKIEKYQAKKVKYKDEIYDLDDECDLLAEEKEKLTDANRELREEREELTHELEELQDAYHKLTTGKADDDVAAHARELPDDPIEECFSPLCSEPEDISDSSEDEDQDSSESSLFGKRSRVEDEVPPNQPSSKKRRVDQKQTVEKSNPEESVLMRIFNCKSQPVLFSAKPSDDKENQVPVVTSYNVHASIASG